MLEFGDMEVWSCGVVVQAFLSFGESLVICRRSASLYGDMEVWWCGLVS